MPKDILLCTLNSTYQHCAFGLRYLLANLAEFQSRTQIIEFTISQDPKWIAEKILAQAPKLIGFGVYIWNTKETQRVVEILKSIAPDLTIVLGGPEVSHEAWTQSLVATADHTILGEADHLFLEFCRNFFSGQRPPKIISGEPPDIKKIKLPYEFYTEEDIANRIIYVEASRGCPYKCEYCLSSLDKGVRNFDINEFLCCIEKLMTRGVRQFKFVDRTFNLSPTISGKILEFFLAHMEKKLFLHFEMVPDRLPEEIKNLIVQFPKGSLQFEIGIQTFNPKVAKNISRHQDYKKIQTNLKFLGQQTHVHTHVDLIVGLPGENLESFACGFDQLIELGPSEIQIGLLKRLKGFPLARHDQNYAMVYDNSPPFQILQTKDLSFLEIQKLSRFAKTWDLVYNSGNFIRLMAAYLNYIRQNSLSYFKETLKLSELLHQKHPQGFGIALINLTQFLWEYFSNHPLASLCDVNEIIALDYCYKKRRNLPPFLVSRLKEELIKIINESNRWGPVSHESTPAQIHRQHRHWQVHSLDQRPC